MEAFGNVLCSSVELVIFEPIIVYKNPVTRNPPGTQAIKSSSFTHAANSQGSKSEKNRAFRVQCGGEVGNDVKGCNNISQIYLL